MRIIAGKFKGKILSEFELNSTRPTADMVREALFDKIGYKTIDAEFLDLFAGTGAVGIEALSRGAKNCYFVDESKEAIKIINKNLLSIKAQNYNILNTSFENALTNFKNNSKKFDVIFLDPPYASDFAEHAIQFVYENKLLNPNGIVVWEHDNLKIPYIEQNFSNFKTKKYGKKYLTYFDF